MRHADPELAMPIRRAAKDIVNRVGNIKKLPTQLGVTSTTLATRTGSERRAAFTAHQRSSDVRSLTRAHVWA
jgi:hypothetical protein